VAYHCPPPREIVGDTAMVAAMLKHGCTQFDANVDHDDALHVMIQYPRPGGDLYNLFVNSIDTHYEFTFTGHVKGSRLEGRPGFIKLAWDPKWKTASTLEMDGWRVEMAIGLDQFDIPAPKVGDVWAVNFMRCWQRIRSGIQSWAWGNRAPADEGHERRGAPAGRMVFGGAGVVAQQRTIGEIAQGKPHFVVDLVNTDAEPRTVICRVDTNSKEVTDEKRIAVPAGGKRTYDFKGRIVDYRTAEIAVSAADAETGRTIMAAGYAVRRPTETEIYLRKYPSHDLVRYELDFTNHAQHTAADITVQVRVTDKDGKATWQRSYADLKDYNLVAEIGTKSFAYGAYSVAFQFSAGGKVIEKVERQLEKKPFPKWYGDTVGFDGNDAPYPWSDMVVRGQKVEVWGRTYDFGNALFPRQVTTQRKPMLQRPMGIRLESDQGQLTPTAKLARAEWTKKANCRVEGVREVRVGRLGVEHRLWMEYDGLVWSTLRLVPEGKVRVKGLALEIPFNKAFSDVYNTRDYSMRHTGKLPAAGYVGDAHTTWLGNAVGGMQWTTETVGPFHVKDPNTCLRITPTAQGALLRIEIVNVDTVLDRPLEIPFGFIATPVRPKTLRTVRGNVFRRFQMSTYPWIDAEKWWKPFPSHWPNKHAVQRGRLQGRYAPGVESRPVPHTPLAVMATNDEAMLEFGDEWLKDESARWRGKYGLTDRRARVTTASRSLQDYIVWRFKQYFDIQPIAGAYCDVSSPVYSSNPFADAGYERSDGTRAPSLNFMGHRQIMKRIYNIQNRVYPGGGIWWHASEGPCMVYQSYSVGSYDGENGNSLINADNPNYYTMLRPDTYRAQYMGTNWGHWNAFLSQGRISAAACRKFGLDCMWDQWTGLQWLHDCYIYTGWFSRLGHVEPLLVRRERTPFHKYHLLSPFNRFIPYWEQKITKLERPEHYVSFYVKQPVRPYGHGKWRKLAYYSNYDTGLDGIHQAVVVFYNHGTHEGPVSLALDWKQLGFADWRQVKAINAVHSTGFRVKDWNVAPSKIEAELYDNATAEYARIADGTLEFPITGYNYRMIVLQASKPWQAP